MKVNKPSIIYLSAYCFLCGLFILAYLQYGFTVQFLAVVIFGSFLVIIAFIDLLHKIIPDKLVLLGLAVGILMGFFRSDIGLMFILKGFAAGFIPMLLIAVISRGQLGFGDVKLTGVMGVFLGWKGVLSAILLAFFVGAVYGLFLMIFLGKNRKTAVPFAPFLVGSGVFSYLGMDGIISWYLSEMLWH